MLLVVGGEANLGFGAAGRGDGPREAAYAERRSLVLWMDEDAVADCNARLCCRRQLPSRLSPVQRRVVLRPGCRRPAEAAGLHSDEVLLAFAGWGQSASVEDPWSITCLATSVPKFAGSPSPAFAPRSFTSPLSLALYVPTSLVEDETANVSDFPTSEAP